MGERRAFFLYVSFRETQTRSENKQRERERELKTMTKESTFNLKQICALSATVRS